MAWIRYRLYFFLITAIIALLARVAIAYVSQRPVAIVFGGVALVIAYAYRHRKRINIALSRVWPSPALAVNPGRPVSADCPERSPMPGRCQKTAIAAQVASLSDVGNLAPVWLGIGGYLPAIKRSVASHAGKKSPIACLMGAGTSAYCWYH